MSDEPDTQPAPAPLAEGLAAEAPAPSRPLRPRLRTAAIVWGLILAASGAGLAWFVLDPHRVTAFGVRALEAKPGDIAIGIVVLVLAIGVIIVVGSLLSVVHRAQDRRRERRESAGSAAQ